MRYYKLLQARVVNGARNRLELLVEMQLQTYIYVELLRNVAIG